MTTGDTPDTSEHLNFNLCDWIAFRQKAGMGETEVSRWLGASHKVGQLMSCWVLPESGVPMSVTTSQQMTRLEKQTNECEKQMEAFEQGLKQRFNAQSADTRSASKNIDPTNAIDLELEDEEFLAECNRVIDNDLVPHADNLYEEAERMKCDPLLDVGIRTPRGNEDVLTEATVKRRAVDVDGMPSAKQLTIL